jgi:lipid A ethanolaminephosphotransferase
MRRPWHLETLALLGSGFFVVFCNPGFWQSILTPERLVRPAGWLFVAATAVALTVVHFVLLVILLNRWTLRWLMPVLLVATAFAVYFMSRYHVYLDPSMLRNVLATDVGEARDLMAWSLLPYLLFYAVLPIYLLRKMPLLELPLRQALLRRLAAIALALTLGVGAVLAVYQEMASTIRNDKAMRYLVTPANYLYALARVSIGKARAADSVRQPIGSDATAGGRLQAAGKPVVLVMVLGETARAANWGLSGYARQTTPELAKAGVINFAAVTSCGTNTETSVPCMFSPWGRRHYDEDRIRGSESLLDVVARAGFRVVWIDNQSGCKGVCNGVESTRPRCPEGDCFDGAMVDTLQKTIAETPGNLLIVMHQMGNHGPAYFKRYPAAFKAYESACDNPDLARCDRQTIVNAYDNAIRYTDHVLASTIAHLRTLQSHQPAMLYVSDHGESLGENGLFLHGIPYAIAPDVQRQVPMVMWLSDEFNRRFGLDATCLAQRAQAPASHDHLFHTLLGLLDIQTTAYEPPMDFSRACRR